MEALLNRFNAVLTEQNAILMANVENPVSIASVTAENGAVDGNPAPNQDNPTDAATNPELSPTLRLEINQISNRLKVILPIVILILTKVLVDNFVAGAAVIMSVTSFYRLKQAYELELALKERSNKFSLVVLLFFSMALLFCIVFEINRFDYTGILSDRLSFQAFPETQVITLLQILWSCAITDGVVLIGTLTLKLLVVNAINWYGNLHNMDIHTVMRSIPCCKARHSTIAAASTTGDGRHPRSSHTTTASTSTARTALQQVFSDLSLSSLGSSFTGLVRRQASTTSTSTSGQYSSLPTTNIATPTSEGNLPIGATSSNNTIHIETVNSSSDGSVTAVDSRDYLLKVRVCALIDMTSLLYRSVLPITWWMAYFRSESSVVFSFITQILYITIKSYDWSRKVKGAIHAGVMFFMNKIEFGHYSTDAELRGTDEETGSSSNNSCDCPICFDNPRQPVTLDCQHIFCEVCILEWLEKEQTCPVCRAQIAYGSPLLQSVKVEASSTIPIVV